MAVALALKSVEIRGNRIEREYAVTLSGNYANSGTTGDLMAFQSATNASKLARPKFARVPTGWEVLNQPAGWVMRIHVGTTMATFGLRFFQSDDAVDPLDEHADAAYAASITGSDGDALRIRLSEKLL